MSPFRIMCRHRPPPSLFGQCSVSKDKTSPLGLYDTYSDHLYGRDSVVLFMRIDLLGHPIHCQPHNFLFYMIHMHLP